MPFPRVSGRSNLECFINCITPTVPSHFLAKTSLRNLNRLWHPWEGESVEYFTLEDLWGCYDEWSAYGAGVPVLLNGEETVIQYYVPYLSALQIFTSNASLSNLREDSEAMGDSCSDCWSEESENERRWRSDTGSSDELYRYNMVGEQESLWWHLSDRLGYPYFQYFERSAPYGRVPLADKIHDLAQRFPQLKTLKSVELSPASWMAVAWYPIYHIPTGRTVKDLSACFLTYHTLSSSFQDTGTEDDTESSERKQTGGRVALLPFGLATYKLHGSLWVPGENGKDQEKLVSLLSAADSWLKQLRVQHHDFNYFAGIRDG